MADEIGTRKRSRDELEDPANDGGNDAGKLNPHKPSELEILTYLESSSDDDFGPAMPTAAPKKKKRKLPYEKLYISALPESPRYFKSLMHREQLSFVTITPHTDFLITTSVDGVVKFWKKSNEGVEFVKEYKAHSGDITGIAVSQDGRSLATAGADSTLKIFDIPSYGELWRRDKLHFLTWQIFSQCWSYPKRLKPFAGYTRKAHLYPYWPWRKWRVPR